MIVHGAPPMAGRRHLAGHCPTPRNRIAHACPKSIRKQGDGPESAYQGIALLC
jgi:hypothetical protein